MFGKGGKFGGGEPDPSVNLNLTALMDILSNLLFFLLASYSTQSVELAQKPDMKLPDSSSQVKIEKELTLTLTTKELLVADVPVATITDGKIGGIADDTQKIDALFERLRSVKATRAAAGQDDLPGSDTIMLLADKGTDSTQIARILKTAAAAGFVKARFGVVAQ
ncbi:MAG: biopolymer transporter ExbD [Deltaproteobacteria bacterium]|nr:biopolymer transporter ExbD [Deltaproteobacteria bacterium]